MGKKVAVYGIGKCFEKNIKYLDASFDITCFLDNDPQKWGTEPLRDGRQCLEPKKINEHNIKYVIISVESIENYKIIKKGLDKIGVESCFINNIIKQCIEKWDDIQIEKYDELTKKNVFGEVLDENKIARYVECYMLHQACNLRCSYCFVGQTRELAEKVIPLRHKPTFIARALSKERLGGTSLISICCDGEPLISKDVIELIILLLKEGHYVYVISNGTLTKQIKKLSALSGDLLSRLFIRFSFHYFELKRLNLIDRFFENIRSFHAAGGSFTLFLVGSEMYLEVLEEIKRLSLQNLGALPQIDYERNEENHDGSVLVIKTEKEEKAYKKIWEDFDSEFLRFRKKTDGKITGKCNAGKWVIHLDLMSGDVSRCPVGIYICNLYDDICNPIKFDVSAHECPYSFCVCAPVFFAFGMKEDLTDAPTFYELWNRKTESGKNWIQSSAKDFFCKRLYESYKNTYIKD